MIAKVPLPCWSINEPEQLGGAGQKDPTRIRQILVSCCALYSSWHSK